MAVVQSLTKPVGGLSALLDHFGHMVGVFPHRLYAVGGGCFPFLCIAVEIAPKPAWSHFGSC